jgi:hypothetical protein
MTTTLTVTAPDLVLRTRSELADLFRAAPPGPIPKGRGRGTVLLGTGGTMARAVARLSYALIWRGKVVDPSAGRLRNLLGPFSFPAIVALVRVEGSRFDRKPCIVLDYSRTSFVAKAVRDEIREVAPDVYLGLVFLAGRHVLDFALDFRRHP